MASPISCCGSTSPVEPPFVIKQCRERLRVAMEWHAPLDRIWTESATLGVLQDILPEGTVPRVLFEDRPDYLFAMTCAPDDAVTWKSLLMEGRVDPEIAGAAGHDPGHDPRRRPVALRPPRDAGRYEPVRGAAGRSLLPDRRAAASRPGAAHRVADRRDGRPDEERTLVLGDFSPKNILVHAGGLILLDFECAARRRPGLRPRLLPDSPRAQGDSRHRGGGRRQPPVSRADPMDSGMPISSAGLSGRRQPPS